MRLTIRELLLALLVAILPLASFADDAIKKQYPDSELVEILQADGYRAVEIIEERVIKIKIDGNTYVLYAYDDDDLQLYYGLTGYAVTDAHMNTWNRTKRLSRAYLDDENDPILEADLLANAGFSKSQFLEWLRVFDSAAREFTQFLMVNDESE